MAVLTPVLVVLSIVAVVNMLVWYLFFRGPDMSGYLYLAEPHIATKPDVMVLEVAGQGSADMVAKRGFSTFLNV